MSLSITNTNHISRQEISAIANCNLDTHLIVFKIDAEVGSKITTLSKREVTCWQLFLRYLGRGNLADVEIRLSSMTTHLNRFNWAAGASLNPNSIHHRAYLKTCMLANKSLYSKHDETLLNNVATTSINKNIEFIQYRGNAVQHRHNVAQSFNWNPCMQIKHIKTLLAKRFPDMQIRMLDFNHQNLRSNTNATRELLYQARITVEQRYEAPEPVPPTRRPQTTRRS